MMDQERGRLQRLQSLFEEAVALPAEQQASFCGQACGDDEDLRRQLLELVAADEVSAGQLEPRPSRDGDRAEGMFPPSHPERIGRYRIRDVIAVGGMGVVYLAEQDHPLRRVAIKVLRAGLASSEARRRFAYETEILGRLQHPAVARIYEAGVYEENEQSLPFFAMEYIAGARTITRFAEEDGLDARARIERFVVVCDAVDSGHQYGIIHRDLKPDNILVDREGRVHVIDFGVARATGADLRLTTLQTSAGQLVGTLRYMSPEQCAADPAAIDVRSDVYALGVVLYELLTGRLPYDLHGLNLAEAARVVSESIPPRLTAVQPRLGGDPATIVEKAMEKDPSLRYRSAGELADDLRRFLRGEAVLARRPSIVYQLRVAARRHKAFTAATLAALATLSLGVVGTTLGLAQARRERDRALEALAFGLDIIESVSGALAQGERIPVSVVTDAASWLEGGACRDQPELEAAFRATLGRAFLSLGRGNLAEPHLRDAVALHRRLLGPQSEEVAADLADLARAIRYLDAEAVPLAREALRIRRDLLGPEHPDTLRSIDLLAGVLLDRGEYPEAERLIREGLDVRMRLSGPDHPDTARSLGALGYCRFDSNDYAAGEPLLRRALEIQRRTLAPTHLDLAETAYSLAHLCAGKRRYAEAEDLIRETLAILDARLVWDHYWSGNARMLLADALLAQEQFPEAETIYRHLLDRPSAELVQPVVKEARLRSGWGECLSRMGHYPEAERQLLLARHLMEAENAGRQMSLRWEITRRLAALFATLGQDEAATRCLTALEPLLRSRVESAPDPYQEYLAKADLGACLTRLGQYEEAEAILRSAYEDYASRVGEAHPEIWRIVDPLVDLYQAWGKPDQVVAWRARSGVDDNHP